MLFPKANMDLHNFLMKTASPESKTAKLDWLLQQMRGLAKALDHMHNHIAPDPEQQNQNRGQRNASEHRKKLGCHHDLNPSNVLVFSQENVLKISDFGLTRIVNKKSRTAANTKSPRTPPLYGDWEYQAPERDAESDVSRPSDIWSLGCIYLVLLLWFFGHEKNIEGFQLDRHEQGVNAKRFWEYDDPTTKVPVLKEVVLGRLQWLQGKAEHKRVFRELVELVKWDMLIPAKPEKRYTAPQVCSELKGILFRARLEMNGHSGFFDDPGKGEGERHWGLASSIDGRTEVGDDETQEQTQVGNGDNLHPGSARRSHSRKSSRSPMLAARGSQFGEPLESIPPQLGIEGGEPGPQDGLLDKVLQREQDKSAGR